MFQVKKPNQFVPEYVSPAFRNSTSGLFPSRAKYLYLLTSCAVLAKPPKHETFLWLSAQVPEFASVSSNLACISLLWISNKSKSAAHISPIDKTNKNLKNEKGHILLIYRAKISCQICRYIVEGEIPVIQLNLSRFRRLGLLDLNAKLCPTKNQIQIDTIAVVLPTNENSLVDEFVL